MKNEGCIKARSTPASLPYIKNCKMTYYGENINSHLEFRFYSRCVALQCSFFAIKHCKKCYEAAVQSRVKWLFSLPVRADVEEISFTALRFSVSAPQQNKECYYAKGNNQSQQTTDVNQ